MPLPNKKDFLARLAPTDECPICFADKAPMMLPCKHKFCWNCISTWLEGSNTCPSCRRKLYRKHRKEKREADVETEQEQVGQVEQEIVMLEDDIEEENDNDEDLDFGRLVLAPNEASDDEEDDQTVDPDHFAGRPYDHSEAAYARLLKVFQDHIETSSKPGAASTLVIKVPMPGRRSPWIGKVGTAGIITKSSDGHFVVNEKLVRLILKYQVSVKDETVWDVRIEERDDSIARQDWRASYRFWGV